MKCEKPREEARRKREERKREEFVTSALKAVEEASQKSTDKAGDVFITAIEIALQECHRVVYGAFELRPEIKVLYGLPEEDDELNNLTPSGLAPWEDGSSPVSTTPAIDEEGCFNQRMLKR